MAVESAPDGDVPEAVLRALLTQRALSPEDRETVSQSLAGNVEQNRAALGGILSSASSALLRESVANITAVHSNGAELPLAQTVDALCAAAGLDGLTKTEHERLLQRQLCYAMFDGVTGSDARFALNTSSYFVRPFVSSNFGRDDGDRRFSSAPEAATVPGMLSPLLYEEIKAFKDISELLHENNITEARDRIAVLTKRPLDPAIVRLLEHPEALYDRLLLEGQVAIRQTTEYFAWRKASAGGRTIPESAARICADPEGFVDRLLLDRQYVSANSVDTTWNHATPAVRDCVTLGMPAFDLPVALLRAMDADGRAALRKAFEARKDTEDPRQREYVGHVLRSLSTFEDAVLADGDFSFHADAGTFSSIAGILQARAGGKEEVKFTRLWKDVFSARRGHTLARELVRTTGSIPAGFYALKSFKEEVQFGDIAGLHLVLAEEQRAATDHERPGTGYGSQRDRVLHARWQLLERFFIDGIAGRTLTTPKSRQRAVRLDARGVRIDIAPPKDSGQTGELHAHVPFAMASDAFLDTLVSEGWIAQTDREEAQLQRAWRQNDLSAQDRLEASKLAAFARAAGVDATDAAGKLADAFGESPERAAYAALVERERRFPASVTKQYLSGPTDVPGMLGRAVRALRLMQELQERLMSRAKKKQQEVVQEPAYAAMILSVLCPVIETLSAGEAGIRSMRAIRWERISGSGDSALGQLTVNDGAESVAVLLQMDHLPRWHEYALQKLMAA